MKLLNRYTIGARLLGLTLFLSAMMLITGLSGLWGIRQASVTLADAYEGSQAAIDQLQEVRYRQANVRNLVQEARMSGDAFAAQEWFDKIDKQIRVIGESLQAFGQRPMTPEAKRLFDRYMATRMKYGQEGIAPIRDMLLAEDFERAATHHKDVIQPATVQLDEATEALITHLKKEAQDARARIAGRSELLLAISLGVMVVGLILSVLLSLAIRRSIAGRVAEIHGMAGQNRTVSDHSAHAARELTDLAERLRESVSRFKLANPM